MDMPDLDALRWSRKGFIHDYLASTNRGKHRTMSLKGKAYIAGAYEHPTRKAVDKSLAQLHAEVAKGALDETTRSVESQIGDIDRSMGELATAVREGLRVITVVFNDGSLSLIEIKQRQGRAEWYRAYRVRVAKVEREYGFDKE